ncbi:MAG: CopG family transcriptional regulator [Candidatus Rokuibacteriota bacterium]
MPTTVRLDAATLRMMGRLARRRGLTKSQLIREAIQRLGEAEGSEAPAESVYDAMEHAIGCWDSGGAQLSERTGERFTGLLRARRDRSASAAMPDVGGGRRRSATRRSGRSGT